MSRVDRIAGRVMDPQLLPGGPLSVCGSDGSCRRLAAGRAGELIWGEWACFARRGHRGEGELLRSRLALSYYRPVALGVEVDGRGAVHLFVPSWARHGDALRRAGRDLKRGRIHTAHRRLLGGLEHNPGQPELLLGLGRLHLQEGQRVAARKYLWLAMMLGVTEVAGVEGVRLPAEGAVNRAVLLAARLWQLEMARLGRRGQAAAAGSWLNAVGPAFRPDDGRSVR